MSAFARAIRCARRRATPDAAYTAGYCSRLASHIRSGFRWANDSHDLTLAFAQGANAYFVAERYGVDLSRTAEGVAL